MSGLANLPDDILLSMMEDPLFDPNDPKWQDQADAYMADQAMLDSVNVNKGAPFNVRASVNAAQRPEDRLSTLQGFYPDAIRVEDLSPQFGADQFGDNNFVYTDPETNELTLFDERGGFLFGASLKDLTADIGPEIAETVGAIGGGIAGVATGVAAAIPTGGVVNPYTAGLAGEGLGSATARETYIGLLNYFGETEDNRTLGELRNDFVFTAGINSAGGPILSKIGRGLSFAGDGVRYIAGGMQKEAREAYKKLSSVISTPTAGQVTMNPVVNLFETVLEKLPASTKTMHEAAKRTLVEIEKYTADLAEKYGGARTTTEASEKLFGQAEKGVPNSGGSIRQAKQRYKDKVDNMYTNVRNLLPSDKMTNVDSTMELLEEFMISSKTAVGDRLSSTGLSQAELVVKDLLNESLTFDNLRKFRTQLLTDTASPLANATTTSAQDQQLKRLIGSITQDLDRHVNSFGNDALTTAYKEANEFVLKNQGPGGDITFINKLLDKAKDELEPALNSILQGSKDGPSKIIKLKNQLTPEEFSVIPGYVLGKMGMPTPGIAQAVELGTETGAEYLTKKGFSVNKFVSNWESLSKEAKDVLFKDSPEFAGLADELDNLVFTVNRVKQSGRSAANPSNTAQVAYTMGLFAPAYAATSATFEAGFSSLIAPWGGAKLMTSPKFVKWLAEGVEIAATNPNSYGNHLRKLVQIQAVNPEIRGEIQAILEGHQGESLEPINEQKSSSDQVVPISKNDSNFRQIVGEEVANKVIPNNNQLAQSIDSFQMPNLNVEAFPAPMTTEDPSTRMALAGDNPDNQLIAMRGIAGLG